MSRRSRLPEKPPAPIVDAKAFFRGRSDCIKEDGFTQDGLNPFERGTPDHAEWIRGWNSVEVCMKCVSLVADIENLNHRGVCRRCEP